MKRAREQSRDHPGRTVTPRAGTYPRNSDQVVVRSVHGVRFPESNDMEVQGFDAVRPNVDLPFACRWMRRRRRLQQIGTVDFLGKCSLQHKTPKGQSSDAPCFFANQPLQIQERILRQERREDFDVPAAADAPGQGQRNVCPCHQHAPACFCAASTVLTITRVPIA